MTRSITIDRGIEIETQSVETIEDFAEMVLNNYNVDDTEDKCNIYFTFDEDLETEPYGWLGIKVINIFDSEALVIGYMGGGGIKAYSLNDDSLTKGYIASCIKSYLWQECRSEQKTLVVSTICKKE